MGIEARDVPVGVDVDEAGGQDAAPPVQRAIPRRKIGSHGGDAVSPHQDVPDLARGARAVNHLCLADADAVHGGGLRQDLADLPGGDDRGDKNEAPLPGWVRGANRMRDLL